MFGGKTDSPVKPIGKFGAVFVVKFLGNLREAR
jgi:hypothetical protein